jgi:outer membrane protein OmpA-like peptidoglycan-associated protein
LVLVALGGSAVAVINAAGGDRQTTRPSQRLFDPAQATPISVRATTASSSGPKLDVVAPILSIQGAGQPPSPSPPSPAPAVLTPILFAFNVAKPGQKQVRLLARMITERRRVAGLRVEGYADDLGTPNYNLVLARERTCNVAEMLGRQLAPNIPPIEILALGEAQPVAPNVLPDGADNRRGRALNRRVEIAILPVQSRQGLRCRP